MADTVDLNNLAEYFDEEEKVKKNMDNLVELVKASKHLLFFTGAGISTSAKIPDFRGPDGCWTAKAQGRAPPKSIKMTQAEPTLCHMGIVGLMRTFKKGGKAAYCVSQNIDGLHRRSGLEAGELSELHGNLFKETCWGCSKEYLRSFDVDGGASGAGRCLSCKERVPYFCHCTARLCECGRRLKDSIIHFRENLPELDLKRGFDNAAKADLCIVLGSSCTVTPACKIPKHTVKNGGKLVIVNLQKTPIDEDASLRFFMKTDEFMSLLMKHLDLPIEPFDADKDPVISTSNKENETASTSEDNNDNNDSENGDDEKKEDTTSRVYSAETDLGGYVQPKSDCPHVETAAGSMSISLEKACAALKSTGCAVCSDKSENWICLTCAQVSCGRYVNGHAKTHSDDHDHCIALSLSDLNTWCYKCDQYVLHDTLDRHFLVFYMAKFGELPPGLKIATKK